MMTSPLGADSAALSAIRRMVTRKASRLTRAERLLDARQLNSDGEASFMSKIIRVSVWNSGIGRSSAPLRTRFYLAAV